MNPLQAISPRVRVWLYWIGYVVGMISQTLAVSWTAVAAALPQVTMPLWLAIASPVIGLAQTQLNLLAGSNVSAPVSGNPDQETP